MAREVVAVVHLQIDREIDGLHRYHELYELLMVWTECRLSGTICGRFARRTQRTGKSAGGSAGTQLWCGYMGDHHPKSSWAILRMGIGSLTVIMLWSMYSPYTGSMSNRLKSAASCTL